MHRKEVRNLVRDVQVASIIFPVVNRHHLAQLAVENYLTELEVPRAGNVARMVADYRIPVL